MPLTEFLPWPIRAVVARLVAPLVGSAVGVLLTLGLISQQGGACVELLARELLLERSGSNSSPTTRPDRRPELKGPSDLPGSVHPKDHSSDLR